MNAEGFTAVARGCRVAAKDTFNNQQGQPVYMLTLIGWGFTRKFISDNKVEFEAWPAPGSDVDVQCNLEPGKDNSFKLTSPRFVPTKAKSGAA
jgi:hypothetical protein